jgi:hypothetical protein
MAVVLGRIVDRSYYELDHKFRMVETPAHPQTRHLLAYWQACLARGGMRMGRDIPARVLAPLMKHLIVAEPVGDWADARLRLVGSAMSAYFGRDASGALLSDMFAGTHEDLRLLLDGARAAIAFNLSGIAEHNIVDGHTVILRQEMSVMPLYAPRGNTRWVLVGTFNF